MAQTGEMTFWDHLEELRGSLFRMLAVFGVAVIGLFFFKGFLFDDVILAPSRPDFFLYRLLGADFSLTLVNIEVAAQFMIHMKITFICALIVTFPYLVFEIWRFVAPALYEKEKKTVKGAFLFGISIEARKNISECAKNMIMFPLVAIRKMTSICRGS